MKKLSFDKNKANDLSKKQFYQYNFLNINVDENTFYMRYDKLKIL